MLAAQYDAFTEDVTAFVVREVPKPKPKAGEVLIKTKAAAINPIDCKVMSGGLVGAGWKCELPFTLGYDVSGVVEETGDGVSNITVGDDVWCVNWGQGKHNDDTDATIGGTFAEYITIPATRLSKKPAGMSHSEAAALALVGTTGYQVVEASNVKKGDRILVLGGSTAVGMLVVQFLKLKEAYVVTTSSPRNKDFVEALGPDRIIDYTVDDWSELLVSEPVDHVIDTVGLSGDFQKTGDIIKEGGTFFSIASFDVGFDPTAHQPKYSAASFFCLSNSPEVQDALASLVVEGKVKVFIANEEKFCQDGVSKLLTKQAQGKSLGKNVLLFG